MLRIFGHYISKSFLLLGMLEFCISFLALLISAQMPFVWGASVADGGTHGWLVLVAYAGLLTISMIAVGLYQRGASDASDRFVRLTLSLVFTGAAMALVFYTFPEVAIGRGAMAFGMAFSMFGILLVRSLFFRLIGDEARMHRVLVLGAGCTAAMLDAYDDRSHGFKLVGFVRMHPDEQAIAQDKLVNFDRPLLELVERLQIDELLVAPDDRRQRLPVDDILDCKMSGIVVLDLINFFEKEMSRIKLDILNPSWIFLSEGFRISGGGFSLKRLFDIVVSGLILTLFSPFMLLTAVAIFIESKGRGSVFFHQVRVGLNGKLFRVHKFRSMRMDAEADGVARWATKNDSRITRVGNIIRKTRLDELPQLFNVLRGDMSLVGPRPERPEFVADLEKEIPFYNERHRVKPGLAGWAQLCYPYGATTEDARNKLEYDLYYVKNASVFLDLIILLETVEIVLWSKGAH